MTRGWLLFVNHPCLEFSLQNSSMSIPVAWVYFPVRLKQGWKANRLTISTTNEVPFLVAKILLFLHWTQVHNTNINKEAWTLYMAFTQQISLSVHCIVKLLQSKQTFDAGLVCCVNTCWFYCMYCMWALYDTISCDSTDLPVSVPHR